MTDQFYLQIAKDRQAALLREAHNQTPRRAGGRTASRWCEFRLTIELRLGAAEAKSAPSRRLEGPPSGLRSSAEVLLEVRICCRQPAGG